ncbi:MAG TPA: sigma-70 family RNA polymerase sigma factor [Ktedonobacterales bacterium]
MPARVYHERRGDTLSSVESEDVALVARLAGGNEEALGQLYDRYGLAVYSLAVRIVHDGATAEEVAQEVFVRLWRAAASFDPAKGKVLTWLLRITHNLALNEIRRQKSRPVAATSFDWEVEGAQLADGDVSVDPAAVTGLREQAEQVRRALAQLPETQRKAIELAFYGGLSQAEVALALGEPLGTVKSRIRAGMQRLGEVLRAQGVSP